MDTLDHRSLQLPTRVVDEIDRIVSQAEQHAQPLELNPARDELFALFAEAETEGCLEVGAEPDLSADALCRLLGERWGLKDAARDSVDQQVRLPQEHLSRMRSLWSVMRMWMEWTYAWQRWNEFHRQPRQPR